VHSSNGLLKLFRRNEAAFLGQYSNVDGIQLTFSCAATRCVYDKVHKLQTPQWHMQPRCVDDSVRWNIRPILSRIFGCVYTVRLI